MQVQVLARHGARTPLTKDALSLNEKGATLTPIGQKECYDLGAWLHSKYGAQLNLSTVYDPSRVRLLSSDFDRTVVSAQSLALGFFDRSARLGGGTVTSLLPPGLTPANVPVYTLQNPNDISIRSYSNCPTFVDKLQEVYKSSDFSKIAEDNKALLEKLGAYSGFAQYLSTAKTPTIDLKSLWNVYDAINVARTECATSATAPTCIALADPSVRNLLTAAEFAALQNAAHAVEHLKYGVGTAGNLLGSNLLRDIYEAMGLRTARESDDMDFTDRRLEDNAGNPQESFLLYSGHYPTILGMFAAMDSVALNAGLSRTSIPSYASALIFELWEDYDATPVSHSVRVAYKDGMSAAETYLVVPWCGGDDTSSSVDSKKFCGLDKFLSFLRNMKPGTRSAWCSACKNTKADMCVAKEYERYKSENPVGGDDNGGDAEQCIIAAPLVGAFFGGAVLSGGIVGCLFICIRQSDQSLVGKMRRRFSRRFSRRPSKPRVEMDRLSDDDEMDVASGTSQKENYSDQI